MSISGVGIKLNNLPELLPKSDAAKVPVTGTTDQVLDLSDKTKIADELNIQGKSSVSIKGIQYVKVGDEVYKISQADLKKLISELKKECLQPNGKIKENFNSVTFEAKTGISVNSTPELTPENAKASMLKRAEVRLKVNDGADVKQALKADLEMIDTKYKNTPGIAIKVLLQDTALLEKKGLIPPDGQDREAYTKAMDNFVSNYKKVARGEPVDAKAMAEDIASLRAIVEKYANVTDVSTINILNEDDGALDKLGTAEAGSTSDQYKVVSGNTKAVLNASDAAIHDLTISTKETGNSGGGGVEGGRDFRRMQGALNEVSKQFTIVEKMKDATLAQEKELSAKIGQKSYDILGTLQTPPVAELKAKIEQLKSQGKTDTPEFKGLSELVDLMEQKEAAHIKFGELDSKSQELSKARSTGISEIGSIRIIDAQMKTNIAGCNKMGAAFAAASGEALPDGTKGLKSIKARMEEIKTMPLLGQKEAALKEVQADLSKLNHKLADEMQGLIDQYKANKNPPADPKVIELLEKEKETLLTQANDGNLSITAIEGKIKELEGFRAKLLDPKTGPLIKLVPAKLDKREFDALGNMDGNLVKLSANYNQANTSLQDITKDVQKQQEDAKKAQEAAKQKAAEEMKHFQENPIQSVGTFVRDLSYDSKIELTFNGGMGFGTSAANIGSDYALSFAVGKSFGNTNSYTASVNFKVAIEANLDVGIFSAHAELFAKFSAGIGFSSPEAVQAFADKTAKAFSDLAKNRDGGKFIDDMKEIYAWAMDHSYTTVEVGAAASVNLEGMAGATISKSASHTSFKDGSGKQAYGADQYQTASLTVGNTTIERRQHTTVLTDKNYNPLPGAKGNESSRTIIELKLKPDMMQLVLAGGLTALPPDVLSQTLKAIRGANPNLAAGVMNDDKLIAMCSAIIAKAAMDQGVLGKLNPPDLGDKKSPVKTDAKVTLGLEVVTNYGKEPQFGITVGFEGKVEFSTGNVQVAPGVTAHGGSKFEMKWGKTFKEKGETW